MVLEIFRMAGRSGALEREKLSVKDGVTHPERREEGSGSGSDLCKDPEVGRAQEGGKKTPVAGVLRAVRTVGELGLGVVEPGQALPLREVSCILRAEYLCSQELSQGAAVSHSWVSLTLGWGCR